MKGEAMSPPVMMNARGRAMSMAKIARYLARSGPINGPLLALKHAERDLGETSQITQFFRAAVTAGSVTADPALAVMRPLATEFVSYLFSLSVIGRMQGVRTVPLNTQVARQTTVGTFAWVPESGVTPLSSMSFDTVSLPITKFVGIVPFTNELLRFANAVSEGEILDAMTNAALNFMDAEFLDPTVTAVSGLNPGSITSTGTQIVCTGTSATAAIEDLNNLVAAVSETTNLQSPYFIMSKKVAIALSFLESDSTLFGHLTPAGGYLVGVPVLISNSNPGPGASPDTGTITLVDSAEVIVGRGALELDLSREATIQLDSAPDSPGTANTVAVSLWQRDLSAIKLTNFCGWAPRRAAVAGYISGVAYRP